MGVVRVIGQTQEGLITSTAEEGSPETETLSFITFEKYGEGGGHRTKELSISHRQLVRTEEELVQLLQVSFTLLNKGSQGDEDNDKKCSKGQVDLYYLLACIRRRGWKVDGGRHKPPSYFASLLLLKETHPSSSLTSRQLEVVEEIQILEDEEAEVRIHLLSTSRNSWEESDADTTEESLSTATYKNSLVVLSLDKCITVYQIETLPYSASSRIEILCSECVAKSFWWAEWVPQYEFLAYAHARKLRQSSFDDEETFTSTAKPLLSVLQFHDKFPRESVLNMPLEIDPKSKVPEQGTFIQDPNILTSTSVQLKLLAHSSGTVYLVQIHSTDGNKERGSVSSELQYSINILHHNKTLDVRVSLGPEQQALLPLQIHVSVYSSDEYLVVVGWPVFVHILDISGCHEPSHHLIFDWEGLVGKGRSPLICLKSGFPTSDSEEKLDISTKNWTSFIFQDLSHAPLDLTSSVLLPLLQKADLKFKLAVIHYLLIHSQDINVAKRVIYEEGKKCGNLHLKQIYQEFLIGFAYLQTKKQMLPNMETFLYLIPYSPNPELDSSNPFKGLQMNLSSNTTDVSTMLLSPSQRVFPHNVTDVWTSLWQVNRQYTRSNRFNHKNVAEKLLLSLQCYKPEALSRASTPSAMSPSSPMCASLGDIAGLFGRRTTELQLPFIEHESCTANKQEYIFSINLRELSMHLLKERKEWPLHGHTVAGKYVCALNDSARLLCHLLSLTVHLQPTKSRDKGFKLIDTLEWETRLRLFMLLEHYALALGTLACPLPQGFTPFFAYLGYRTVKFDQFLWHVRAGTFDLQIDLVKNIMADLKDSEEGNVAKKLHLLSLLPKSRASRVLNGWSHPMSISLRARQHSSDLLSGVVSQTRKSIFATNKKKKGETSGPKEKMSPLDTFFHLLTAKANASDIDLGLLTEATMISMDEEESSYKNKNVDRRKPISN